MRSPFTVLPLFCLLVDQGMIPDDDSPRPEDYICGNCGKKFDLKKLDQEFCSPECKEARSS